MTDPHVRSAIYSALIFNSTGMVSGEPERRLSGGQSDPAPSDQGAGPRSSDCSGTHAKDLER